MAKIITPYLTYEDKIQQTANIRFDILIKKIYDLRFDFMQSVYDRAQELRSMGISDSQILKEISNLVLNNDDLIKTASKEATEIYQYFKTVSQFSVWDGLNQGLYQWVYNPNVAHHCPGCIERNGQIDTLANWKLRGLPGSGVTVCGWYCYCNLVLVTK